MSLQTVVLGMLRSPASGYELRARLEATGHHYWSASLSQIYPLLARMEQNGLLHSGLASSRRGPPRKLHGLTDRGRQTLAETLESSPQLGVERLPWLAEISMAGAHHEAKGAQQQLTRLHQHFAQQCAQLQAELAVEDTSAMTADGYFERAARRCALATAQARVHWCEETLMGLDAVPWPVAPDSPAPEPPAPG